MNAVFKKLQCAMIALVVFSVSNTWANGTIETLKTDVTVVNEALIGAYVYTVENVPIEYSTGVILIDKPSDTYTVIVKLTNGELAGEDVEVVGNSIKFNVFIEGQTIAVELTVDGDVISGKSTSYDGTFFIEGKRQVEKF
ncbi:MAG: hypothetical protein WBM98_05230 [Maribacter sp.]|uniref:hypothetical protein n=1 Tax=Maribacter sp. TaxID=1897614 RepID=UPI003C72ABC2